MRISASWSSKRNARQHARQLGLADAGRAQEDERADRPPADRAGRRGCGASRATPPPPPRPGRRRACGAPPPCAAASAVSSSAELAPPGSRSSREMHRRRSVVLVDLDVLRRASTRSTSFLSSLQLAARSSFSWSRRRAAFSNSWPRIAASFSLATSSSFFSSSRISVGTVLDRQPRARARLVDHVDRLVREEAVVDVAVGELAPPRRRASSVILTPWCASYLSRRPMQDLDRLRRRSAGRP